MNLIKIVLAVVGIVVVLISLVRWLVVYNDVSQAVIYSLAGFALIVLAWIIHKFEYIFQKLDNNEKRIDSLTWPTK